MESWVEASSCSCERVFSYVTATDFGQSTECMSKTLWVRCNGEAPEDWGPFEVLDELPKTSFRQRKRKERHVVEVEDGALLGFAAFKDLQVSLEEGVEAEVPLEILDMWVVPKRATGDAHIGDVYGVALEVEDEATAEEVWIGRAKLLVALLLTFLTGQPCPLPPLPPLTLLHN